MEWYVVKDKSSGKFADGYYGWDGSLHQDEQIFPENELPYKENSEMEFILVGRGDKPSVMKVQEKLQALADGVPSDEEINESVAGPKSAELPSRQLNVVDLSTGHLPQETARALDNGTFGFIPMMKGPYGWMFYVTDDVATLDRIPCESLKACLKLALKNGFSYVWFDADGEVYEELPIFDW